MEDSEDSSATPRRISGDAVVDDTPQNGNVDSDVAHISADLDDATAEPTTPTTIKPSAATVPTIQHEDLSDNPWDGSELDSLDAGSVEGLPRRAGSPAGSVGSAAQYAPSLQVCQLLPLDVELYTNMVSTGLSHFFTWEQRLALGCLASVPEQSNPVVSPVR